LCFLRGTHFFVYDWGTRTCRAHDARKLAVTLEISKASWERTRGWIPCFLSLPPLRSGFKSLAAASQPRFVAVQDFLTVFDPRQNLVAAAGRCLFCNQNSFPSDMAVEAAGESWRLGLPGRSLPQIHISMGPGPFSSILPRLAFLMTQG